MDKREIQKQIQKHTFIENNGMIMRTLNILDNKEHKLGNIKLVMHDVPADELDRSLHYLLDSGYIRIRYPKGAANFESIKEDNAHYKVDITHQGMDLLMGITENPAVEI